ncbi:hypothetical protein JKP88DRAFT_189788 [Tribonema minus]|uniref:Tetratricopeptide repeat protein n=1 Tax=Tribonema minus TaxID=303371 RepID=A0A836C9C9_9STRA|nr:hypothetical protein JKP88DRAFT_189788 [Tribonema minus]
MVTRQLMRTMRRWFCEGRRGVLVDCLFDIVRTAADPALAAIAQEYIWTSWNCHKDPEVVKALEDAANHMARQNCVAAVAALRRAVALDPLHAEGRNRLSTALFLAGRLADSEAEAARVLELEPRHFGALNGLAILRMRRHDYAGALPLLEKVVSINPRMSAELTRQNIAVCHAGIHAAAL